MSRQPILDPRKTLLLYINQLEQQIKEILHEYERLANQPLSGFSPRHHCARCLGFNFVVVPHTSAYDREIYYTEPCCPTLIPEPPVDNYFKSLHEDWLKMPALVKHHEDMVRLNWEEGDKRNNPQNYKIKNLRLLRDRTLNNGTSVPKGTVVQMEKYHPQGTYGPYYRLSLGSMRFNASANQVEGVPEELVLPDYVPIYYEELNSEKPDSKKANKVLCSKFPGKVFRTIARGGKNTRVIPLEGGQSILVPNDTVVEIT